VGRIRYLGVVLYDADRIQEAASVENEKDLYQAQLDIFLDPHDPKVIEQARKDGIPEAWLEGARNSPVYKMAMDWKVALPLHPETTRRSGMCRFRPSLPPSTRLWALTAKSRTCTRCVSRSSTGEPAHGWRQVGSARWSGCWRCAPTSGKHMTASKTGRC
jgi:nitrate reductase beta subunit